MKKSLISATVIALALSAGAALAADLPSAKKRRSTSAAAPAAAVDWLLCRSERRRHFANNNNDTFVTGPLALSSAVSSLGAAHQVAAIAAAMASSTAAPTAASSRRPGWLQLPILQQLRGWPRGDIQGVAASNSNATLSNVTVGPGFSNNPVVTTSPSKRASTILARCVAASATS